LFAVIGAINDKNIANAIDSYTIFRLYTISFLRIKINRFAMQTG